MSVTTRGGSYQVAFSHGGRRYRKQFQTHSEAAQWEADARASLTRGEEPADAGKVSGEVLLTLQEALQRTYQRYWQGSKSEQHLLLNGRLVVEALGPDRDVRSVTARDLDWLIDRLKTTERNSNATINRKLSALSKILKTAERYDPEFRMPRIEKLREPEGRTKVFTDDEIEAMCVAARDLGKPWLADLIIIGMDTGLRLSEIINLRYDDVLTATKGDLWITVRESKNGKSRRIPCTSRVVEILQTHRTHGREVFDQTFPHKSAVQTAWGQVRSHMGRQNDKDWVFHTLRHTFCSNLVRNGVDVLTVAKLAGHSSIQVTMRYAKLAPDNLSEAIGVLN